MDEVLDEHRRLAAMAARTDLLPGCPFRPLDWRWQRAGQLRRPRARLRRWDDGWIIRARRFLADLDRAGGDPRHPRLARAHPEVLDAYLLRQGPARRRWEAEARLLAGQADAEIADRVGVGTGVIEAYEALFYHVRHRLRCSDWVAAFAIGDRLYQGLDAGETEVLWKALAYHGGPVVLDALIDRSRTEGQATFDPRLAGPLDVLIEVMTTPVTPENAPEWIRIDAQVRAIGRAEGARGVLAVTGPVVIPPFEVAIGPETVPLLSAGCVRGAPEDADRAAEGQPIGLSEAG
jgi:hypothetical protein